MAFNRVAILGTGLIGASVGLAIKAARPTTQVVGYDASGSNVREAQRMKAIDRGASLSDAVRDADLVVVATPVGAMRALFEEIAPLLKAGAVVTDTGSTKGRVLEWARAALPETVSFVGGHPMGGKTDTGPEAAEATLFQNAVWCVVPSATAKREAVNDVIKLVESLGAAPYFLDAEEHDGLVASVSHLPYLLSVALVGHLGTEPGWREAASLAAGGFAYASHLSDSDPQMYADVAKTNREHLLRRLDLYIDELTSLREAIAAEDPQLKQRFERARDFHQDWLHGKAQAGGQTEPATELPSNRQMLVGGLFGNFGRNDKNKKER